MSTRELALRWMTTGSSSASSVPSGWRTPTARRLQSCLSTSRIATSIRPRRRYVTSAGIASIRSTADPRFARRPDRRGRSGAAVRRDRSRRRPVGRVHRPVRGGRAPRRRRGLPWQGCADSGSRNVETEIAPALTGLDARDQAAIDRALVELDGTDNKGRLSAPTRSSAARLPLRRPRPLMPRCRCTGGSEGRCPHLARADAERRQRRRPRAERARPPGIHARPVRRRELRRGAPDRSRDVPRPPRRSSRLWALHGRRRRGRFRSRDLDIEEAIKAILLAAEHAGHRDRIALALDPAATEPSSTALTGSRAKMAERDGGTMIEFYAELAERYPLVSIEDGPGGRMGDWSSLDRAVKTGFSLSATTSSPASTVSGAASRHRWRTRSS